MEKRRLFFVLNISKPASLPLGRAPSFCPPPPAASYRPPELAFPSAPVSEAAPHAGRMGQRGSLGRGRASVWAQMACAPLPRRGECAHSASRAEGEPWRIGVYRGERASPPPARRSARAHCPSHAEGGAVRSAFVDLWMSLRNACGGRCLWGAESTRTDLSFQQTLPAIRAESRQI